MLFFYIYTGNIHCEYNYYVFDYDQLIFLAWRQSYQVFRLTVSVVYSSRTAGKILFIWRCLLLVMLPINAHYGHVISKLGVGLAATTGDDTAPRRDPTGPQEDNE